MKGLLISILCLCCFALQGIFAAGSASSTNPLIIVPGLSASALQNTERTEFDLLKRVWVNEINLEFDFYQKELSTYWVSAANVLKSNRTVEPYEGLAGVRNIAGLGPDDRADFVEFADLIDRVNANSGTADAVPYDWRLVPQQEHLQLFMETMQEKIEQAYYEYDNDINGGILKPIVLAHSLGNLMSLYFFSKMDPTWTAKFVGGFVSTSAPYLGAGLGLLAVTAQTYNDHGIEFPSSFLGNFACFPWVFPRQYETYYDDVVIDYGASSQYTPNDIPLFMNQYSPNFDSSVADIYNYITYPQNSPNLPQAPNVGPGFDYSIFLQPPVGIDLSQVWIVRSWYQPTVIGISYQGKQWVNITEQKTSDPTHVGDGTVPYDSLHVNDGLWLIPNNNIITIRNVSHSGILTDGNFLDTVMQIIGGKQSSGGV